MRDQITNLTQKFPTQFAIDMPSEFTTQFAVGFERNSDRVLDAVVDANRRLVEFAVATADRVGDVGEQFSIELPFADKLPTPTATGERYLDFVERAVSINRDFNERIVSMLTVDAPAAAKKAPVVATHAPVVAKKAPARKPAARKATATKPSARKTTARKTIARKATATK